MPTITTTEQEQANTSVRQKAVRLFTYLEKALALDDAVVRDFRNTAAAPSPWWLAEFPQDAENLYIRPFETESGTIDGAQQSALLRVEKKNIKAAPPLPKELEEWISDLSPIDQPKPKEKIEREIRFDQDADRVAEFKKFRKDFNEGQQAPNPLLDWVTITPGKLPEAIKAQYSEDYWVNHPELQRLLQGYINKEWTPWAEKVRKTYQANLLYDQLYALRLLLKNEGDSYELLLGHGLLTWQHAAVGAIYAPIFLTPLAIDFDAGKRVIEISADPMFRGFVETSPLYEMDNPAEMDIIAWTDAINSNPFDFWHLESLKTQSRTLINYASTDSEDRFTDIAVVPPDITHTPAIWNAPVIFARKRNNDLWSKYAGLIRRDIEQNNIEPTEFIIDLIGEYAKRTPEEGETTETAIQDPDLFFPLPWNDEQKRIAERLDANYGVVVKGPPGTGKSHTIANLISRFLAQGKTVLVTSQTSKALDVLREKLPENIRSLAVSQLHQTTRRDGVLQQSISEISSNLGERDTKFSEQKAEAIRKELHDVRQEKARLANEIRQYILTDSSVELDIEGERITPIDAAKLVSKYQDNQDLEWFTDTVSFKQELTFSEDDLTDLYTLLSELSPDDRNLPQYELSPVSAIPAVATASQAFAAFKNLSIKSRTAAKLFGASRMQLSPGELNGLLEKLIDAKKVLSSISSKYEQEIFRLCASSNHEQKRWQTVLKKLAEHIDTIGECNNALLGHEIIGSTDMPIQILWQGLQTLEEKTANGTRISTFGKLLLPSPVKRMLEAYTIDGYPADIKERVLLLQYAVVADKTRKDIQLLLKQSFATLTADDIPSMADDVIQLEVLCSSLKRVVEYVDDFAEIDAFCKSQKPLVSLSFTVLDDIEQLIDVVSSCLAKFELSELDKLIAGWIAELESFAGDGGHKIARELITALEDRSADSWAEAAAELKVLHENKHKAERLAGVVEKVKHLAPRLFTDIVGLADNKQPFTVPENLVLAWKLSRLSSWLNNIHDHISIDELQNQLERLTKKEYQLNSELVTILAWQRQIDKVTKPQRDALMAWSHEMRQYGKGTGKHANKHLRAAQEALKEAKNAVPVWIMPLHRAAQMFSEPVPGMFDVVIFDEASQCDIRGLTIGYLGKKLLVVGDPEQISPAGIFQDQERIFELISRFLYDIPFRDSFSITSSLFDLAKIRLASIIQLNEHFRCVPDIIAFSNHHIYEGKLKPLRYPHPKGLLKPALIPVYVEGGYQNTNNKVNEPEAQAIVDQLVKCLKDPQYNKRPDGRLCTFGIISLLAEDQAKYIDKLIHNLITQGVITEKDIEERRIECGDAYKFQGDERDVMLLSMVRALNPNDKNDTIAALANEDAKRRFNVAASRARDQMFLFHSMPVESLGNQNDWRYKLISWFYDPKKEELQAGREILKKEFDSGRASQFSYDVGNLLIDRGYLVLPEYPVIGYRIDLVVQGEEARLAVECDGDQYHTLENWEEDQARERQLRRAGWEFWRVTGSAFYRHKEEALESLWTKLDEMGIKPVVGQ